MKFACLGLTVLLLWPLSAAKAVVVVTAFSDVRWLSHDPNSLSTMFHPIDMDFDGAADFTIASAFGTCTIRSERANRILYIVDPPPNIGGGVAPISLGSIIGAPFADVRFGWSSTDFLGGYVDVGEFAFSNIALQLDAGWGSHFPEFGARAPIGVEFLMADGVHYGYLDIFAAGRSDEVGLYGWAYETQPGVPIQAALVPEPSTAVYVGGSAFLLWQRNSNTRKQNKALLPTPRGRFVSALNLIRKWLGFGGARSRP